MNDPVARGSAGAQAVEVIQSAAMHIGAGGGEGFSRGIRTGEPEDLMACADELRNGGRANPAGRAGDETRMRKPPWDRLSSPQAGRGQECQLLS